jgi:hypothetical protein
MDRIQNAWTENDIGTANADLTVTHGATIKKHNVVIKVDASFSDVLGTGLLTVKFGAVTKGRKYIFGAGALDFSEFGYENPVANEAVSATLTAGGVAILGCITMTGYSTGVKAGD